MKSNFIKCFIVFAVVLTASVLAGSQGMFSTILKNDASYICAAIMLMYGPASLYVLATARAVDKLKNNKVKIKALLAHRLQHVRYIGETFFGLGLLGTIVGFCLMMNTAMNADQDVRLIITQLKVGVSTALYTTLIGMCASMPLRLQEHLLDTHE